MRLLVRIVPALAVLIVIAGLVVSVEGKRAPDPALQTPADVLPTDRGSFRRMPPELPESAQRTLANYYGRRAYPNAPPVIPHRSFNEKAFGGGSCLGCHRDGSYTPPLKAWAPITPHPELASCVSCHVFQEKTAAFAVSDFRAAAPPELGQRAMPGSPPAIPHTLEMRSDCLACHFSAASPKEIRTTHPERANCRQCHAAVESPPASGEMRFPQ